MRLTSGRPPSRTSLPWTCRPHSLHSLVSDSWKDRQGADAPYGNGWSLPWISTMEGLESVTPTALSADWTVCMVNALMRLECESETFVSATFGKELGRSASLRARSRARSDRIVPVPVPVPDATSTLCNSPYCGSWGRLDIDTVNIESYSMCYDTL